MKRLLCSLFLLTILCGCSSFGVNIPGQGDVQGEANYNIKIYTDADIDLNKDGSIKIDDTTIFYLNSDDTKEDMIEIYKIFEDRYGVYKHWVSPKID